jgi:hypothetical protein
LAGLGLILASCHPHGKPGNGLDGLDNRLVDGGVVADNAATRALAREIRVDPQAKPVAARAAAATGGEPGRCLDGLVYARAWATRLPDDLPMHPRATLQEAAGHDGACQARVVSFTVPGGRGSVIAWYAAQARAAGYSVGRDDKDGDWNLAGGKGDAVYYIMAGPTRGGATPVDYVWSAGG